MSVNMDDEGVSFGGTEYADFRHQLINGKMEEQSGNSNGSARIGFAPLDDLGGLQPNEVAELVMIEIDIGHEREVTEGPVEFRGVIGANLDSRASIPSEGLPEAQEGTVLETNGTIDIEFDSRTEAEYFVHFRTHSISGSSTTSRRYNFRENYGRGPVLDDTDEITGIFRLVNELSGGNNGGGAFAIKLVWDVAETDDSGRAFSVPMSD